MRDEYIFALIIIIILSAFVIKALHIYSYGDEDIQIPDANWIAAVDYNNDGKITRSSILSGEDYLLRVVPSSQEHHVEVTQFDHLPKVDQHDDDVITIHDPQYQRIQVLYIPPNGDLTQLRLVPLHQVGIYGIRLNENGDEPYHNAILSQGRTRSMQPPPPLNQ
jgi:hypothetical protein